MLAAYICPCAGNVIPGVRPKQLGSSPAAESKANTQSVRAENWELISVIKERKEQQGRGIHSRLKTETWGSQSLRSSQQTEELPVVLVSFPLRHQTVQLVNQLSLHLHTGTQTLWLPLVSYEWPEQSLYSWACAPVPVWSSHSCAAPSPSCHGKSGSWCFAPPPAGPASLPGTDQSFREWSGSYSHLQTAHVSNSDPKPFNQSNSLNPTRGSYPDSATCWKARRSSSLSCHRICKQIRSSITLLIGLNSVCITDSDSFILN